MKPNREIFSQVAEDVVYQILNDQGIDSNRVLMVGISGESYSFGFNNYEHLLVKFSGGHDGSPPDEEFIANLNEFWCKKQDGQQVVACHDFVNDDTFFTIASLK